MASTIATEARPRAHAGAGARAARVFISVGEPSGDLHAANLIREMRALAPQVRFEGFGGGRMQAAGCKLHADTLHLASMGISFLSNFFSFVRLIWRFHSILRRDPPDCVVLVDFPGFNFILARIAHWSDLPVVYYICPQIWAWAPWRRRKILALTDLLMVILPFEEEYYREPGKSVVYVGHPIADALAGVPPAEELESDFRRRQALDDDVPIIGLFPGSRDHEVHALLPLFRKTLERMSLAPGAYRVLVSSCRDEFRAPIEAAFRGFEPGIEIVDGDAYPLMAACRLALVASGTATLELAWFEKPMVVFYKVSKLAHTVYRWISTSPFICLVNIVSGAEVVPEEVSSSDNSGPQAERARRLLGPSAERERCLASLAALRRDFFRPGGSRRAAQSLAEFLES